MEVLSGREKLSKGNWSSEVRVSRSEHVRRKEISTKPSIARTQLFLQLRPGHFRIDAGYSVWRDKLEKGLDIALANGVRESVSGAQHGAVFVSVCRDRIGGLHRACSCPEQ